MKLNWGWRIAIVYTLFAGGTLAYVAYAMTQDVDLVREDYYAYSLSHDKVMAARARADALGATAAIDVTANDVVAFVPPSMVQTLTGTLDFYRPNSPASDKHIALKLDEQGRMLVPRGELQPGKWKVTLAWKYGGVDYEIERSFEL